MTKHKSFYGLLIGIWIFLSYLGCSTLLAKKNQISGLAHHSLLRVLLLKDLVCRSLSESELLIIKMLWLLPFNQGLLKAIDNVFEYIVLNDLPKIVELVSANNATGIVALACLIRTSFTRFSVLIRTLSLSEFHINISSMLILVS